MIRKDWTMCGLDKAICSTFQSIAMNKNMKTSLFKEVPIEIESDANDKDEEIDFDLHVKDIMNKNLNRVIEVATINKKSTISTLKELARKKKNCLYPLILLCFL
jgi:hypothetical protein